MIIVIIILIIIIVILGYKLSNKIILDQNEINEYRTTIHELNIYKNNLQEQINKQEETVKLNNNKIKELQEEYEERYNNLDEHFEQLNLSRSKFLEEDFQRRKQDKENALNLLSEKYSNIIDQTSKKTHQLEQEYQQYELAIAGKIAQKQQQFDALLQPLKQYEKEQQDKLFYTVQIPEEYRTDIQYLLVNIAPQLKHPDIINKLIWTEYVRPYLDETCKRVGIENKPGIYKITNIINNKPYIGKSTDMKKRIAEHFKAAIGISTIAWQAVHDAMKDEGLWNWAIEPIIYCDKDKLNELEKFYIDFFQTQTYGFNRKSGG